MATVISKNQFVDFDGKSIVDVNKIYVEYQSKSTGERERVPVSELYTQDSKRKPVRKIKSYSEFVKKLEKNLVFTGESGIQTVKAFSEDVKIQVVGIKVPSSHTTIELNPQDEKIPYGLKRSLKVQEANDKVPDSDNYYYVKINGEGVFLKPTEIYFYDKSNKKRLFSSVKNFDTLEDVDLYTKNNTKIDLVYTEKKYYFPVAMTSEKIDFEKFEKVTIEKKEIKKEDGTVSYEIDEEKTTSQKIDKYFSEQHYIRKEIEDERRPGKTKEVSLIAVKNYQIQPNGEYYALTINGFIHMVKRDEIVNEDGSLIDDVKSMVGKAVNIKRDGEIVAKTSPLSYEQANFTYSTIKTYQETEAEASDNSYLRLKDGRYVKELEVAKPISYKRVNSDSSDFDAYLVRSTDDEGNEHYVVVSKEYYNKNKSKFKDEDIKKLQRCPFDSDECELVQTTSKGTGVEQCSIVKKCKLFESTINVSENVKDEVFATFMAAYVTGEYLVKDTYVDDKLEELSRRRERYINSDYSYLEDYADNLHQYAALKTDNFKIENGKLVGGPKYDVGKGIKSAFGKLGKMAGPAALIWGGAGIFIPVVGPIISAAIVATYVGAIPFVPLANAIYGVVKNHQRSKFMDKAEYNQKVNKLSLEKRIEMLYERMTSKDFVPYSEARFEDEYSKLYNDIISLSTSTINNELIVVDGVAQVTPENAAAAKVYMNEFNSSQKQLKRMTKKYKRKESKFTELDNRIKRLEEEGRRIPEDLQRKYDKAKLEFNEIKNVRDALLAKHESLMNYRGNPTELCAHTERDRLLRVAEMMKSAVYLQSEAFSEHPLVQEAIEGLVDCSDVMTTADLARYVITEADLGLTSEQLNNMLEEALANLSEEERARLTAEQRSDLLQSKIDEALTAKCESLTEEEVYTLIEERNMNETIMNSLILDSKDKELQKKFGTCTTIQEKIDMIRKNEQEKLFNSANEEVSEQDKKSKKKSRTHKESMLDKLEFNVKEGLSIEGIGVGAEDEIIRGMVEYGRSRRWLKVKQAVEFVHNGLNPKEIPIEHEEIPDDKKDDNGERKDSGEDKKEEKVVKTKLSISTLENLLSNIDILQKYDELYEGPDEDIPANIEIMIAEIEAKIKPDLHLLQRAAKNPKYDKYLTRVRRAAKIVQDHQSPRNRKLGSLNM